MRAVQPQVYLQQRMEVAQVEDESAIDGHKNESHTFYRVTKLVNSAQLNIREDLSLDQVESLIRQRWKVTIS